MDETISRVRENPPLFPVFHLNARRALVEDYPYGILFVEHDEEIVVAGVLHLHRDPEAWTSR